MAKTKTKTTKTKTKKTESRKLVRSDVVQTPLVVWLAADIDSLPTDIWARLQSAITEVTGVPCVSISVSAGDKIVF